MKIIGIVPARLQSTRLPEKALIDLMGMPMVVHTCKRASLAERVEEVYLATDSEKIADVAREHGVSVIMTGSHHETGSDRLAEAAADIDCDIVVNVQGDEPLVNPDHIDRIVEPLIHDPSINIAVGLTPYSERNSTSDIKAVTDLNGNIMYCSRTDLPSDARSHVDAMMKMCFIVPFRKDFLLQYATWEQTPLERVEFNEYLRVIERGERLRGVIVEDSKISVDTPEDLATVRQLMEQDVLRLSYTQEK